MVLVAGDADGEGVAGDAPGDVVGEGGVGGAGGGDGVGAAGDGLVDGVSCDALVARVLLMMVQGVCPCLLWWKLGGRKWFFGSPVVRVLAVSEAGGCRWLR